MSTIEQKWNKAGFTVSYWKGQVVVIGHGITYYVPKNLIAGCCCNYKSYHTAGGFKWSFNKNKIWKKN